MSDILLPKGWKLQDRGRHYKCRVCGHPCSFEAISSPNYAFYHEHCVKKSPSYQKAVKAALKDKEEKK